MWILNNQGKLSSRWFRKPSDTGLIMNFHSLAPVRYKRSVVVGCVHRIFNSCSTWELFHESLSEAKDILHNNQYPSSFYEPLIHQTLTKLLSKPEKVDKDEKEEQPFMVFLNYRGKCSDDFAKELYKICNNPEQLIRPSLRVIFTIKKLKTALPQLKPTVPKMLRSGNVYQITCPGCNSCYVGQSVRHLQARYREHKVNSGPMLTHITSCGVKLTDEDIEILGTHKKSEQHLLTLEALFLRELNPKINTKKEYKMKTLVIKI